jgi:hypothetical protein
MATLDHLVTVMKMEFVDEGERGVISMDGIAIQNTFGDR